MKISKSASNWVVAILFSLEAAGQASGQLSPLLDIGAWGKELETSETAVIRLPLFYQAESDKDLVDLALLVTRETMNQQKTEQAIRTTFDLRQTHAIPESLAAPPNSWEIPFRTMAEECQLDLRLEEAFEVLRSRWSALRLQ